MASLNRTHVDVSRSGNQVVVSTRYDENGGWFSHGNGADVDYRISVPSMVNLDVANVSGPISIASMRANLPASDVSGAIDASLGFIGGSRSVSMKAVSGAIALNSP